MITADFNSCTLSSEQNVTARAAVQHLTTEFVVSAIDGRTSYTPVHAMNPFARKNRFARLSGGAAAQNDGPRVKALLHPYIGHPYIFTQFRKAV
ncbi:MAG: hypothetical protein WAR76_05230 [Xanthobacteraceae bacterium]